MDLTRSVWLLVSFAGILIWFGLASRLILLLREHHLGVYESLGSPSLVRNNTIRNNWLGLKFLATGSYRKLDDPRVARLCGFMRVFLILCFAWIFGPLVWAIRG